MGLLNHWNTHQIRLKIPWWDSEELTDGIPNGCRARCKSTVNWVECVAQGMQQMRTDFLCIVHRIDD
ncbi:hypothetical protein WR25_18581 [Diploscapter pachys]|uniref:Uncharacterized protein n=1 Tax=Diploscapter pachys TaxID=2018661 RepID=A0A2A2K8W4_9BILA|nr:hypothetical protein WR25_18581 [Diploscapter pachys]